jgi:hypothetical protein
MPRKPIGKQHTIVRVKLTFRRYRGRKTIVPPQAVDQVLSQNARNTFAKALAKAYRWRALIEAGDYASVTELARAKRINGSYACRILRLSLLAPQIVEETLKNNLAPKEYTQLWKAMPANWSQQWLQLSGSIERQRPT